MCAELFIELPPGERQRSLEREGPIREPEVQIQPERRPLEGAQSAQVERDRVRDDFLKESLAKLDRAVLQHGRLRSFRVPPKFGALRDERTHHDLVIICRGDELHRGRKESIYLIFQAGALAVESAAAILHAELVHELIQRPTQDQIARLRPHRLRADPREK